MAGHDRLTPEGKRFFQQIAELKKLQVRVGYQQGEAADENGVDMADIAMFNELGTARSPARPFLRQSADNNKNTIEKFCKAQLQQVAKGGTAQQALNAIGVMQTGLVQNEITTGGFAPNAPSTIANKTKGGKKGDVPLIDTGKMMQSVHHVIKPKGGD
jgi:hypothetical protein